ncbi:MAG: hypothetical protein LCH95_13830 [Proteobacteria bacterium]|nr:hypothetical protein [Pseudomonadota bacterium]
MFVFKKVFPFTTAVKVPEGVVPGFEFKARFVALPQSRLDQLLAERPERADEAIAREAFKGWLDGELLDEAGEPLAPTEENIAAVIDQPWLRGPIMQAYFGIVNGWREKN